MLTTACLFAHLTDEQLLTDVKRLVAGERCATVNLIASLAELDARRLYLSQGFPSLYKYCTECLHLSEHAAYGRIEAARAASRWPVVLEMLSEGAITLTSVCLLSEHLTADNHRALLDAARHKTRREVEHQVAALRPRPDVPSTVRKLCGPSEASLIATQSTAATPQQADGANAPIETAAPATLPLPVPRPAVIVPLTPERYKVQMTVSRECHDKLRRAQDLLRHAVPDGDPAVIFERALTLLLSDLQKKKLAQTDRPRAAKTAKGRSRHVPAAVRRAVWKRDEGRCAFVGPEGRCTERGFLELHHVFPFAEGGATTADNVELCCRMHNAYEAERWFGPLVDATEPEESDAV